MLAEDKLTKANLLANDISYLSDMTKMKGRYETKYVRMPIKEAKFVFEKNDPTKKLQLIRKP